MPIHFQESKIILTGDVTKIVTPAEKEQVLQLNLNVGMKDLRQ
jgi:hypothetical protein